MPCLRLISSMLCFHRPHAHEPPYAGHPGARRCRAQHADHRCDAGSLLQCVGPMTMLTQTGREAARMRAPSLT